MSISITENISFEISFSVCASKFTNDGTVEYSFGFINDDGDPYSVDELAGTDIVVFTEK